jgi:hypothetical protein
VTGDPGQSQDAGDTLVAARWHRCRLWTIRQNNRKLGAEIVRMDEHWHLRLFAQGVLFLWHPCQQLDLALEYAEMIREDLARDGWA